LQIIVDDTEGQERPLPLEESRHVGEATIETAKHGKHGGVVQDNLTQVVKCISHPLQAMTILRNRHITLDKSCETRHQGSWRGFCDSR
jgi:hypothetical protein